MTGLAPVVASLIFFGKFWMRLGSFITGLVLLLVILLVVGNARRKKKTISFEEKKAPEQLTQAEKSGNYQATGGFDFAPAKKKEPEVLPGQEMGDRKSVV